MLTDSEKKRILEVYKKPFRYAASPMSIYDANDVRVMSLYLPFLDSASIGQYLADKLNEL